MKINFTFNKTSSVYYGIGANHDFAGCVVQNGKIIQAIEAERINRIKHGHNGFNTFNSVSKYLFSDSISEINSISTCNTLNTRNISEYLPNTIFYNHHLCHAASVFFTSPFEKSAILVTDGLGSRTQNSDGSYNFETVSMYLGENTKLTEIKKIYGKVDSTYDEKHIHKLDIPNSLGIFYTYITKIVGFDFLEDGKTMGLSSYGNSDTFYDKLSKYIKYEDDHVLINFTEDDYNFYKKEILKNSTGTESDFQLHADFAASGQKILEEILLFYVNNLYEITGVQNLCLSGGVALNSVANGRILKESKFKNIFLFPACGDSSIAVGSAMLSYYKDHNKRTITPNQSPFLGKKYSDEEIIDSLLKEESSLKFRKTSNIHKETAKLLSEGEIVAWFQGASEFGPRALGNRSILANPSKIKTKDYINNIIKNRELFRPLAPAVLIEYQNEYFESSYKNPYMLFVDHVRKEKIKIIPAVTHVDDTARIQTVDKDNTELYLLLQEFFTITQLPVILNTSFNTIKGEPIVESPDDAIKSFLNSKLKYLAIGNYLCYKEAI